MPATTAQINIPFVTHSLLERKRFPTETGHDLSIFDQATIITPSSDKYKKQQDDINLHDEFCSKDPEKYSTIQRIAYGGMKNILQVRDKDTNRDVAMAVLLNKDAPLDDKIRFIREARITASLEHPNIVPVHDIGIQADGTPFFTMKLLQGETLTQVINKINNGNQRYIRKFKLLYFLQVFQKICYGIEFAHSKGIIHLDLKPENIQIGRFGEVLVIDWGLAKHVENVNEVDNTTTDQWFNSKNVEDTLDGVTKGSLGFMSPEQASGRNSERSERTDIYALGGILYMILTGQKPIVSCTIHQTLMDTTTGRFPSPRERDPQKKIPATLDAIVMKAMATRPEDRYQTVRELRKDIVAFMTGHPTQAEKAGFWRKTQLMLQRHSTRITFSILLFTIMILFTAFVISERFQ